MIFSPQSPPRKATLYLWNDVNNDAVHDGDDEAVHDDESDDIQGEEEGAKQAARNKM